MHINYGYLLAGARAARGIAVIIDVFRAFTCTPLMFSLGLKESILTNTTITRPCVRLCSAKRHKDF